MDTCTCNGESLCCSAETTSALLIGYTPVQNEKFKVFWEKKKKHLTLQTLNIVAEQLKYSSVASGNVKWYNHFGNQIGCF